MRLVFRSRSVTYCTRQTHAPYHVQKVQSLHIDDYPCQAGFMQLMLRMMNNDPRFPALILFSDEGKFNREGIINLRKYYIWSDCNPS